MPPKLDPTTPLPPGIPGNKPPPPKPGEQLPKFVDSSEDESGDGSTVFPPAIPRKVASPRETVEDIRQKKLKKRTKVVQEMISTEVTYIGALEMMINVCFYSFDVCY